MAKITGLGMSLNVDDHAGNARNISEDVNSFTSNQNRALIDVTGLDKFAFERLGGLKDADLQIAGPFDPTANKSHDVFKNLDNSRTFVLNFAGSATLTAEMVLESYAVARAADGALTYTVSARIADGNVPAWT